MLLDVSKQCPVGVERLLAVRAAIGASTWIHCSTVHGVHVLLKIEVMLEFFSAFFANQLWLFLVSLQNESMKQDETVRVQFIPACESRGSSSAQTPSRRHYTLRFQRSTIALSCARRGFRKFRTSSCTWRM